MLGRRSTFWLLTIPPLLWLLLFFVAPVILMGLMSLREDIGRSFFTFPAPTIDQYSIVWEEPSYLRLLGLSALMALGVGVVATALAFPIAYFLTFRAGERANFYLILLLIPFWTSYLLRVMAWKLILGSEGVVNSFLTWTGSIHSPLEFLLYNRGTVIVTLVYVWIPFAVLPIYASMARIDRPLLEAAADLGAGPWPRFWRVTLPLAMPGAIAAFFMVFIPTIGEYVTPLLVGGSNGSMYGNLIQDFFTKAADWPLGSALAVVMLVVTIALVAIAARFINIRRFAAL
jgi:spermidine/putrescine transport system permease protein